jgi:hypothetical protein
MSKVYYSSTKEMSWIDLGRAMLVALLVPASAAAQLQVSAITRIVLDAGRQAVVGATVVLQDSTGTTVATRTSAADGSFKIADVAPGAYVIRVELHSTVLRASAQRLFQPPQSE